MIQSIGICKMLVRGYDIQTTFIYHVVSPLNVAINLRVGRLLRPVFQIQVACNKTYLCGLIKFHDW